MVLFLFVSKAIPECITSYPTSINNYNRSGSAIKLVTCIKILNLDGDRKLKLFFLLP
jgi:hypothetical protein